MFKVAFLVQVFFNLSFVSAEVFQVQKIKNEETSLNVKKSICYNLSPQYEQQGSGLNALKIGGLEGQF